MLTPTFNSPWGDPCASKSPFLVSFLTSFPPPLLPSAGHTQIWAHYEEQPVEEVPPVPEEKERSASYKPVFVTEITDDLHFYVQDVETGEC